MRAYETKRFTEWPDVGDIRCEARKSITGRLKRDHGYMKNKEAKAATRRSMKRSDKAKFKEDCHEDIQ